MKEPAPFASSRAIIVAAAFGYTLFVIYGSLVPFEFRALPWAEALARFRAIPFLQLGIGSRADWVANLLLFIPLTFLWMGAFVADASRARRVLAMLLLIPAATALSVAIEFTQLFFPQRTVSQNDILAETLGGVLGVAAWSIAGRRFVAWLEAWRLAHARAALVERLAWVYLTGLLVYNVLPLDLTLSVVELYHKWRTGNLNLIPFGRLPDAAPGVIYEIVTDVLIWVPLALLWRMDGTRSASRVWVMTFATAATLEFLQIFVFSRVSDVTDLITAAVGGAAGFALGGRGAAHYRPSAAAPRHASGTLSLAGPFALAALWAIALLAVFWFPFDFRADGTFLRERLDGIGRVPFKAYYFGTEFRAVTEVFHKTLFFAPLGGLLAWGVANQPWRWRNLFFAISMLALAGLPAFIEWGQLMLPEKIVEVTDWLLAWLGGLGGYVVTRRVLRAPFKRAATLADGTMPAPAPASAPHQTLSSGARWHMPLAVGAMALAFWGMAHAPFVPYNVRELIRPEGTWLSALLLGLVCYWLAVWPVWLARRPVSGALRLLQVPFGLAVYGGVAFVLLNAAVPDESLHDLVGTPVLNWPGKTETALRWLALASVPGALLYLAAQTVRRARGQLFGALHFVAALPVLLMAYWSAIAAAATDNLTELLARPQALAFACVCASLYLVFLGAAWLASPGVKWRLAVAVMTLPAAALFLHLGLADEIDKYGQRFSALQFLLSPDRAHYASAAEVWMRYVVLHFLVVTALTSLQWPYYRSITRPPLTRPHRKASHDYP